MATTVRSIENNLKRLKEGKTDWFFCSGVYGGLFVIVILLIMLFCTMVGFV